MADQRREGIRDAAGRTAVGRRWPGTADWPGRSATRWRSARPAPAPRRGPCPPATGPPTGPVPTIGCPPAGCRRSPGPVAHGAPCASAACTSGARPTRPRRCCSTTPPRSVASMITCGGRRHDPAVEHPGRQHQHVGREPVAADVTALPHPAGAELIERRGHRTAADRAAHVVRAVRAHRVDRGTVVGRSRLHCQPDRASRTRWDGQLRQFSDPRQNAPTPGVLGPAGNRRAPTAASPSTIVRPGRRIATTRTCCRSSRAISRCAAVRSNRESSSPVRPHGPGCSTSSNRDAGKAVPSIGSPRSPACTAQRSDRSMVRSVTLRAARFIRWEHCGRHDDALPQQSARDHQLFVRIQGGQVDGPEHLAAHHELQCRTDLRRPADR